MKNTLLGLLTALATLTFNVAQNQNFKLTTGKMSFFSETPVENIDAHSESIASVITPARKVAVSIPITSFKFKNALMQEHFNEKYMESEKFPNATFNGVFDQDIELNMKGSHTGSVTGRLKLHGIEKEYTIPIKLTVPQEGHIDIEAEFNVKVADHGIEIPKLVFEKIAETIKVKFKGAYDLKVETKAGTFK